jgi:hypothetical protein
VQLTSTLYPKLSAAHIAFTQAENALAKQLHTFQSELAEHQSATSNWISYKKKAFAIILS